MEIRSRTSTSLRVRSPTGLERLYRDSRSGPFQPMTTNQTYEHLGKYELGLMEMPGAPAEAEANGAVGEVAAATSA